MGFTQKDSKAIVDNFFKFLIDNNSSKISISRFGSFISMISPQRIGRNPKTLEEFIIKKRKTLSFYPSKEVKKDLN